MEWGKEQEKTARAKVQENSVHPLLDEVGGEDWLLCAVGINGCVGNTCRGV